MNILVIVKSNDAETVWNAFRFATASLAYDNRVSVFLLGKGIEAPTIGTIHFDVAEQIQLFREHGGSLLGCGVCVEKRRETMPLLEEELACELGSMQQLYELVAEADRILTF
jgi:uncharacterized protein involved in oxidation of intracellular sulfur